jgi:hypothetical protein
VRGRGLRGGAVRRGVHLQLGAKLGAVMEGERGPRAAENGRIRRGGERIGYGGAPPARQRRRRRCRVPAGRSSKVRKTSGEVRRTSTGLARACPGLNDRFGRCPGGRLQGYGWPSQAPEVLRATKWATYPMQTMRAVQTCIFLIWTSGYKSEGYVER